MRTAKALDLGLAAVIAAVFIATPSDVKAQGAPAVTIGEKDIGGVVIGPGGPEAGVWVIAETKDLPTRFAKIVVTDDQGRYLVPDLPRANYSIWVRGYGLADSAKVPGEPGKTVNLTAQAAPNAAAAAQVYPAIYWYSMLKLPAKSELPENVTIERYLNGMKNNGCVGCHQLGQLSTRTIPKSLGEFKNSEEAWMRRVASGQAGSQMVNQLAGARKAGRSINFRDPASRASGRTAPSPASLSPRAGRGWRGEQREPSRVLAWAKPKRLRFGVAWRGRFDPLRLAVAPPHPISCFARNRPLSRSRMFPISATYSTGRTRVNPSSTARGER